MKFRIGTSGWNYNHWREVFYPKGLAQKRWLRFYQDHFDTVEINNSFYRQPNIETWENWEREAPEGFHFAVKASRFISHFKRFKDPESALKVLFQGVDKLEKNLGPLLNQARPDFKRTPENADRMETFLSLLPRSHDHALEFRHESWFGDDTMAQLRKHGVAFCSYDMPGMKCPLVATAGFVYMRFHGSGQQYAGNYTDDMLKSWAGRLRQVADHADQTWVYFNNDALGYAVNNAMRLREILYG